MWVIGTARFADFVSGDDLDLVTWSRSAAELAIRRLQNILVSCSWRRTVLAVALLGMNHAAQTLDFG